MQPPKDDLFSVLDASLHGVREGDIILVTSKVVAIHEGRCIKMEGSVKEELVMNEADYFLSRGDGHPPMTMRHNALISSAGIDESNGSGYYTFLPEHPFDSARRMYEYLRTRFKLNRVGVIVTDSHSLPFRYGATSISIGSWGFVPVESHVGRSDLFGRVMKYSSTNIADSLAAASAVVCGECDESQPIVIARGVPSIEFTDSDMRDKLMVPFEADLFKVLFKDFRKCEHKKVVSVQE